MLVALAMPPPSRIVSNPYRPLVAYRWLTSAVRSRVPEAPKAWPTAIPPPRGLRARVSIECPLPLQVDGRDGLVRLVSVYIFERGRASSECLLRRRNDRREHQDWITSRHRETVEAGLWARAPAKLPAARS